MANEPKPFRIVLRPLSQTQAHQDYGDMPQDQPGQNRYVEADFVKQVSDKVMLVGINPGKFVSYTRGFMGGGRASREARGGISVKQFKENQPEFYRISRVAIDPREPHRGLPAYEVERQFETILSMNIENIISINGKPVMSLTNLNAGVPHLEVGEEEPGAPPGFQVAELPPQMGQQPGQPPAAEVGPVGYQGADVRQNLIDQIAQSQEEELSAEADLEPEWHGEEPPSETDEDIDFTYDDEEEEDDEFAAPEDEPMEGKDAKKSLSESTGICNDCKKGDHEKCGQVLGRNPQGPVFCTCWCSGDTSLGNIMWKESVPDEVKAEFPKHEIDPLDQVF